MATARVDQELSQPGIAGEAVSLARSPGCWSGDDGSQRWFFLALVYLLLIDIAFAFLMPVIYMASTSLMTVQDFLDPGVYWIPRAVYWDNLAFSRFKAWTTSSG